jgi:hypothetical protein
MAALILRGTVSAACAPGGLRRERNPGFSLPHFVTPIEYMVTEWFFMKPDYEAVNLYVILYRGWFQSNKCLYL